MSDQVRQVLMAMADAKGGLLMPEAVVEAARPEDSPLHECFTWDDRIAGEAWRLQEARVLIRTVRVDVRVERIVVAAPYFIRDPTQGQAQGYRSLGRLLNDDERAREAVVSEFQRAAGALKRAKIIAAVLGLEGEIETVERMLGVLIGHASAADETRVS